MAKGPLRVDAEKIRKLRQEMGMSQYAAAAKAGFHRETWTMIEAGTHGATVEKLGVIADVLCVSPCDLLTHSPGSKVRHGGRRKGGKA